MRSGGWLNRQHVMEGKVMDREMILKTLRAQININGHIIGAVTGSGMTAKSVSYTHLTLPTKA